MADAASILVSVRVKPPSTRSCVTATPGQEGSLIVEGRNGDQLMAPVGWVDGPPPIPGKQQRHAKVLVRIDLTSFLHKQHVRRVMPLHRPRRRDLIPEVLRLRPPLRQRERRHRRHVRLAQR